MAATRFLVVGCGGIGGVVCASLLNQGHAVIPLTTNSQIADAVNLNGFVVRGEQSLGSVRGRAVTALPKDCEPFDFILLCTQPPQVEEAARSALRVLKPDGAMVVFQNGICEPRIAEIAGSERVIGGVIAWGASMVEPGIYDRTSSGGFTLGSMEGPPDDRVAELALVLEAIGPVSTTDNLMGARWSKMAINCAISSLGTVGGDRFGPLLRRRFVRRLALEVMSEAVAVARAEGATLQKVAGTVDLEWLALTADERETKVGSASLVAKHALLLAVGTRYRRLRSSMLNAIERGRPPAIDFLNGEVVERGKKHGIDTPINSALQTQVWDIARGKARPSHDLLEALYERTRELFKLPREPKTEPVPASDPRPEPQTEKLEPESEKSDPKTEEPQALAPETTEPATEAESPRPEPNANAEEE